jgi:hypothetical protein
MKRYVKLFEGYIREDEENELFGDSEDMPTGDMPTDDMPSGDMTKEEIIEKIAQFFKTEVLSNITPKEKSILAQVADIVAPEINEHYLNEGLRDRMSKFKERAMIGTGLSATAVGFVGMVSQVTGWSESEIMTALHDYFQDFGFNAKTAGLSLGLMVAGLTVALKGYSDRGNRLGTPYTKDKPGTGFNSY